MRTAYACALLSMLRGLASMQMPSTITLYTQYHAAAHTTTRTYIAIPINKK